MPGSPTLERCIRRGAVTRLATNSTIQRLTALSCKHGNTDTGCFAIGLEDQELWEVDLSGNSDFNDATIIREAKNTEFAGVKWKDIVQSLESGNYADNFAVAGITADNQLRIIHEGDGIKKDLEANLPTTDDIYSIAFAGPQALMLSTVTGRMFLAGWMTGGASNPNQIPGLTGRHSGYSWAEFTGLPGEVKEHIKSSNYNVSFILPDYTIRHSPEVRESADDFPLTIKGFSPLYITEDAAKRAGDGSCNTYAFDETNYYMPNGVPCTIGDYTALDPTVMPSDDVEEEQTSVMPSDDDEQPKRSRPKRSRKKTD